MSELATTPAVPAERTSLEDALDRERALRAEAEDQAHLRSLLLESVNDAVISMDLKGRVWGWNAGAERVYGYRAEDVVGRPLPDIDGAGWPLSVVRQELDEVGRWEGEVVHRHSSGEIVVVQSAVSFLHDQRGERVAIVAVNRDVTERRRAQQERRDAEQRLRHIVERIDSVLYLRDMEANALEYVSPAFERVWGRPRAELDREPEVFRSSVHPDDRAHVEVALARALTGRVVEETYRIMRPDGSVRWVRDRLHPEVEPDGRVRRLMGIAEDVTEEKRLEANLRQAQKLEALGTLASGIAHDFNNLLMGIAGCVEIALDTLPEDSSARMYLEEMQKASMRGRSITRQLLHFARKRDAETSLVDAHRVLRDCERLVERLLGEDISTRWELRARHTVVECDPAELEQVVLNLCANARAAMPAGGRLVLTTLDEEPDGGPLGTERLLRLRVQDDGCGMDELTRNRIFDPFFTTKKPGEGTGLGLSSVYGIVQRLGGSIDVRSAPGQGATFDILLPCAEKTSAATVGGPRDDADASGSETILLVEDDRLVRMSVRYYLEQVGYRVLDAEDGTAAMECIARFPRSIDLLLTDMVLPGRGGRAIAEALQKERPATRVLFMSAHTEEQLLTDGRLLPGDLSIQKPLEKPLLLRRVRQALDGDTPSAAPDVEARR